MALELDFSNMTRKELVKEAIAFSKYQDNLDGAAILNEILEELKWIMSVNEFNEFKNYILNEKIAA